jgi:hypothetical protein
LMMLSTKNPRLRGDHVVGVSPDRCTASKADADA